MIRMTFRRVPFQGYRNPLLQLVQSVTIAESNRGEGEIERTGNFVKVSSDSVYFEGDDLFLLKSKRSIACNRALLRSSFSGCGRRNQRKGKFGADLLFPDFLLQTSRPIDCKPSDRTVNQTGKPRP